MTEGGSHDAGRDLALSPRFRWLQAVRERQERRERTAALRARLKVARDAGKARRHAERLRKRGAA